MGYRLLGWWQSDPHMSESHSRRVKKSLLYNLGPWVRNLQSHCVCPIISHRKFQVQDSVGLVEVFGEGNGNPLQCSCLGNPTAGGAWWAAVHGVEELDRTERLHFHFSFSCLGAGNGRQPTPVLLPGESQGRGSLLGRCLWGRTESDSTEVTQQQQLRFRLKVCLLPRKASSSHRCLNVSLAGTAIFTKLTQ